MKGISQDLMILVLGIFVLCLVFTAGCSQSTGTSPTPAAVSSTPSPSPTVSWTGVWNDTAWNMTMTLIQINGSVSGTYLEEENATSGNVSGTVSNGGYNLTGTWSEENASGSLELTMAKSQDHFTGGWTIDNQTGPWNGVRSPAPAIVSSTPAPAVSWTGVWNDVDWNMTMTLAQTNGSVSGTYLEEENATLGNVSGTVSNGGYTLTGTWSEGAKNGPFELTMAKSQDHFTGWCMSGNQSADMTKYPWGLSVRSST
ncbi:hypothetical protein [Methanosphaerula subterraneus]|uniref:hypothetical protein n=1 Tax=Methanosphaerula subterraneus TaxID=3350244 RepID=UPI003F8284A1